MEMIYSSAFARKAAGFKPIESVEVNQENVVCGFCGAPLPKGSMANKLKLGQSFVDRIYMAEPNSKFKCPDCESINVPEILRNRRSSVVTEEGWFPVSKWHHLCWFLLNPPRPPFLFFVSDSKNAFLQQHMVWRTPVSLSPELFYLRHGNDLFVINHSRLMAAFKACQVVTDALNAYIDDKYQNDSGSSKLRHPFLSLDDQRANTSHGSINPLVYELEGRVDPDLINLIAGLNSGEAWALFRLVFSKNTPEKPSQYGQ